MASFSAYLIRLGPSDNVAVARQMVPTGLELTGPDQRVTADAAIPQGHKIALDSIRKDQPVIKYGQIIGFATQDIFPGQHVHSHNLVMRDFGRDYQFGTDLRPVTMVAPAARATFEGYLRPDGRIGTRNYVAVISSVNCSASTAQYVRDQFRGPSFRTVFPNVDGVVAFTHKSGCCNQPGEPTQMLQRVLAGFARQPNIFGYVMIGLGCEGNQVQLIRNDFSLDTLRDGELPGAFFTIQESGGTRKTVAAGREAVAKLCEQANTARRTTHDASKLILAMECGGSDANSGITANPAVGVASDLLVAEGGTSVLAETPEIYGAEHLLTRRAVSKVVGEKLVALIHWWEAHAKMYGATIDNNPTPGNKAGGLTTIYEKSLGAVAKAGQSPLTQVYKYAEPITTPGLGFMDSPGYDPVSMTGMVAGGATLGVFTTGRGSCYGCKPTPTLKIASNTAMYETMIEDMDINAGTIMDGTETVSQVGQRIFDKLIAVASGEPTKSEAQGLGDEEFAPWIIGPTF